MEIYVKKYTAAPRFVPHYNRTTGKYYDTKREYFSDLKSKGLEPFNPESVRTRESKPYKPSKWAREIARTIERDGVTGCVRQELAKVKGMKAVPKTLEQGLKEAKGGWF